MSPPPLLIADDLLDPDQIAALTDQTIDAQLNPLNIHSIREPTSGTDITDVPKQRRLYHDTPRFKNSGEQPFKGQLDDDPTSQEFPSQEPRRRRSAGHSEHSHSGKSGRHHRGHHHSDGYHSDSPQRLQRARNERKHRNHHQQEKGQQQQHREKQVDLDVYKSNNHGEVTDPGHQSSSGAHHSKKTTGNPKQKPQRSDEQRRDSKRDHTDTKQNLENNSHHRNANKLKANTQKIILPAPSILDFMTEGEVRKLTRENTKKNVGDPRKQEVDRAHFNRVCRRLDNIQFDERSFVLLPPAENKSSDKPLSKRGPSNRHGSLTPRHMLFSPSRFLHSRTAAAAAAAATTAAAAVAKAEANAAAPKAESQTPPSPSSLLKVPAVTSPVTPCCGNEADDENSFNCSDSEPETLEYEHRSRGSPRHHGRNEAGDSGSRNRRNRNSSKSSCEGGGGHEGDISGLFDDSDEDDGPFSGGAPRSGGLSEPQFVVSEGESSASGSSRSSSSFSASFGRAARSVLRKSFHFKSGTSLLNRNQSTEHTS